MNKNLLVTGANGNLGSAVVEKMSKSGYQVAAVTRRKTIFPGISKIHHFVADLTDDDQVKKLADEVYFRLNTIDAVILTAGGFTMGSFETTSKKELEYMFASNFETSYYLVRHLLYKMMLQPKGGRFIFLGAKSALNLDSASNSIAYALSKSLILQLSGLINSVGNRKNIFSYVIAPSIIDTPENRLSMPNEDSSKWVAIDDIVSMIELICSDKGSSIRNSVIKMYGNT